MALPTGSWLTSVEVECPRCEVEVEVHVFFQGNGVETYVCGACGHEWDTEYDLPLPDDY